ncbi:MAG: hypothetical protein ACPH4O_03945 [Flavobacteriaceae bacterium]
MKTIIFILSIFLATSCSSDDNNQTSQSTTITFTEIGKGVLDGNGSEGIVQSNLVIANNTDWQNLMNQMNSVNNITDNFSETNIDFNTYQIIAIFKEVKPTNWEVEISSIVENANNLSVSVVETEYDFTVVTQPFHIIKISKTNKEIVFEQ